MAYSCEIKERAPQPVLSMRIKTTAQELPQQMGRMFGAVAQYLGELGEPPAGPPFAAYHNMDMQNLDVEGGFPVSKVFAGKGEIQAGEIPGGKAASCLYTGPYPEMVPAYNALTEFVKANGCEPTGVSYEFYLNDPAGTPPQNLMTMIVFPLKGT